MVSSLPVYPIVRDAVKYTFYLNLLKKDLKLNIRRLIDDVVLLKSKKQQIIDEKSDSETTTSEYYVVNTQIQKIENKTIKLTKKHCRSVDENGLNIADLDGSSVEELFRELEKRKLKIVTKNPWKLAKLNHELKTWYDFAKGLYDTKVKKENLLKQKEAEDYHDEDINDVWTKGYVDEVLERLKNNRVVGIVGTMGMESTVIKMLNKRQSSRNQSVLIKPKFGENDKVILQNQIMKALNMDEDKITDNVDTNKGNIADFLRGKNYILLMDDVSSFFEIMKSVLPENHDGKVVMASGSKKVAEKQADHVVVIEKLSKEDSWKLFVRAHGEIGSSRTKEFSEHIIHSCGGGIPLLIIQIAKYLKKHCDDERSYELVRDKLLGNKASELHWNPTKNIFMIHYEKLKDPVKKCLLYEALFPPEKDIYKDYLIECWMAEEFIDAKNGFRTGRNEGSKVLRKLIGVNLLDESNEDERFVTMPRCFRTVALTLKYPGEFYCKIWAQNNGEEPDVNIWKTATRISLTECKTNLPERSYGKKLRTLLLRFQQHQQNPESTPFPDDFFKNMNKLLMLDLQGTKLKNLPGTVRKLESLRCLYLSNCDSLCSLPTEFRKLNKLQLLDISGTGIGSLPQEIQFLIALRCLRATLVPKLTLEENEVKGSPSIIPPKLIESLTKLEELSIDIIKCEGWKTSVDKSIVVEIASLGHLNSLHYNFPNMESLNTFASSSKSLKNSASFRSFQISVDSSERMAKYPQTINERRLSIYRVDEFPEPTTAILKQANCFELIDAQEVKCLNGMALEGVEVCLIQDCRKLECIIDGDIALEFIRKLHLYNLKSLQHIWNGQGQLSSESLKRLVEIKLHGCPELKTILNHDLANALAKLKYLEVKNCHKVSHVLEVRSSEIQDAECKILNKLETLVLTDMPELKSICTSTSLNWEFLRGVDIRNCTKLMDLLTLKKAQRLKTISCGDSWKTEVMQQEENKWLSEDKFEIIDGF